MNKLNVKGLGQVFTRADIVDRMLKLRKNKGSALEPSCGDGAFFKKIPGCVGIEFDAKVCPKGALCMDFFDYPFRNKFDTIIGNPPFVSYPAINHVTMESLDHTLFDARANLYLFFMAKCVEDHMNDGAELIFLTPRHFIGSTSAFRLNTLMAEQGAFTHFYDLGDAPIFDGAMPNVAIWRWVKGRKAGVVQLNDGKTERMVIDEGRITFPTDDVGKLRIDDLFDVKVAGLTGGSFFEHPEGRDVVTTHTFYSGNPTRMLYNVEHPDLEPMKAALMRRKVRKFDEQNWYQWGRAAPARSGPRIYVNETVRSSEPFYVSDVELFSGSVLGLFPKHPNADLHELAGLLNAVDWSSFTSGGRFMVRQGNFCKAPLPPSFDRFA